MPILVGFLRPPGDPLAAMYDKKVDVAGKLMSVQSTNRVQETLFGIDITDRWEWIVNAFWPMFLLKRRQNAFLINR